MHKRPSAAFINTLVGDVLHFHLNLQLNQTQNNSGWHDWDFRLWVQLICQRLKLMQPEPVRSLKHVYGNECLLGSYFYSNDGKTSRGASPPPLTIWHNTTNNGQQAVSKLKWRQPTFHSREHLLELQTNRTTQRNEGATSVKCLFNIQHIQR